MTSGSARLAAAAGLPLDRPWPAPEKKRSAATAPRLTTTATEIFCENKCLSDTGGSNRLMNYLTYVRNTPMLGTVCYWSVTVRDRLVTGQSRVRWRFS